MRIVKEDTLAIVIDVQERLFPYIADNVQLSQSIIKLLEGIKVFDIPILLTEQYKKGLGETIPEIKSTISPSFSFEKLAFSCCDEPVFMQKLEQTGKKNIIICGIESHICILQTTIDLIKNNFQPIVVADCVSSRKLIDKQFALDRMRQEGAIVSTYESLLFELCRFAGNDQFKAIAKIIK
jgi:nicotinamidase-related amidase